MSVEEAKDCVSAIEFFTLALPFLKSDVTLNQGQILVFPLRRRVAERFQEIPDCLLFLVPKAVNHQKGGGEVDFIEAW